MTRLREVLAIERTETDGACSSTYLGREDACCVLALGGVYSAHAPGIEPEHACILVELQMMVLLGISPEEETNGGPVGGLRERVACHIEISGMGIGIVHQVITAVGIGKSPQAIPLLNGGFGSCEYTSQTAIASGTREVPFGNGIGFGVALGVVLAEHIGTSISHGIVVVATGGKLPTPFQELGMINVEMIVNVVIEGCCAFTIGMTGAVVVIGEQSLASYLP